MPIILGFVLVLSGLLFKVSAVPFHMWAPDIYQGAPIEITMLLATMSKFTGVLVLIRLLISPFHSLHNQQIMAIIAVISILLGSLGALKQKNIKRFMAYSSISHIGYILLALVNGSQDGFIAAVSYILIYLISTAGMFVILTCVTDNSDSEGGGNIEEIAKRISGSSIAVFATSIFMFSMAGLPPLVGFFAKFYVFMPIIENGMLVLAVTAIIISVLSISYYLRIVKIVCFTTVGSYKFSKLSIGIILLAMLSSMALFATPSLVKNTATFMVKSLED